MTRSSISPRLDAGFTLVELLVTIALVGLIMIGLSSSLSTGLFAWHKTDAQSDAADQVRSAQSFLRQTLQTIYPLFMKPSPTEPGSVSFDGSDHAMSFFGKAPAALGYFGWARFDLRATEGQSGYSLTVSVTPDLPRRDQRDASKSDALLQGLKDVRFSYYGGLERNQPASWHDRWANQSELPELIRVEITFAAGDRRQWPALVVHPQIDVDVACEYDRLTTRCRGRQ